MDGDALEFVDGGDPGGEGEAPDGGNRQTKRLNSQVALTVALLATFLAICNVKGGNVVQAMQQAQAKSIDYWAWYQARNIREAVYQSTADQLRAQSNGASRETRADLVAQIVSYQRQADEQNAKKAQLQNGARAAEAAYAALNRHDDQIDLSEALLALAIALLALTSLTQKRWLFNLALVPTAGGILMGLAGLFEWGIHPGSLMRWLSA